MFTLGHILAFDFNIDLPLVYEDPQSYTEAVTNGMTWVDKTIPWVLADPGTYFQDQLALWDCKRCVLGQALGGCQVRFEPGMGPSTGFGIVREAVQAHDEEFYWTWMYKRGFAIPLILAASQESMAAWAELTDEWERQLAFYKGI